MARSGDDGESYPDPLPLPVKLLSDGACQVEMGRVSVSFSNAAAEQSVGERAQGSVLSRWVSWAYRCISALLAIISFFRVSTNRFWCSKLSTFCIERRSMLVQVRISCIESPSFDAETSDDIGVFLDSILCDGVTPQILGSRSVVSCSSSM